MEHTEMVRNMNTERYRDLLKNWQHFLESDLPLSSSLASAQLPVYRVADKSIRKIYSKVIRDGLAITDNSPAESLHDLRKRCKNLRYLVDFFRSMYPSEKIRRFIKVVKVLQDNLGDFQDYETQALKLREFAHQMEAEGEVPRNTLAAIDYLAGDIEERKQYARLAFGECFADFAMPVNQKLVHNLLDKTIHRRTLSL
jgi:CHAD domain-containing protein